MSQDAARDLGSRPDGNADQPDTALIYGTVGDSLVYLPVGVVEDLERDYERIRAISTLGQARQVNAALQVLDLPGLDDEDYADELREGDELSDDRPYDAWKTDQAERGEWPPRLGTIALEEMPVDLEDIGQERDSFPGQPDLYVDPASEAEVVFTISNRGYTLERDDERLRRLDQLAG